MAPSCHAVVLPLPLYNTSEHLALNHDMHYLIEITACSEDVSREPFCTPYRQLRSCPQQGINEHCRLVFQ